ncbi:MAG: PKD domain-containing protein [Chitinophagales bacterium]
MTSTVRFLLAVFALLYTYNKSYCQFTPLDVSDLSVWLSADSGVTLTAGEVSQWSDLSGNNFHAQSTPGNGPTQINSVPLLNNKATISFDGSNDYLDGPIIPGINTSSVSVFIVTKGNSQTGSAAGIFNIGALSTGMWIYRRMFSERYTFINNVGSNSQVLDIPNSMPNSGFPYRIHGMVKSYSSNTKLFINGAQSAISNNVSLSSSFTNDNYIIGFAQGFQYYNGEIAEIIVYKKELSSQERLQIENYLNNKYAPPVSLGPDIFIPYSLCDTTITAEKAWYNSYTWSTGETTPSINVNSTGIYSVTVNNIFNQSSTDTIQIFFPNSDLNQNDTTICLGDTLNTEPQLSNAPYFYEWNTGDTSSNLNIASDGMYSVKITDSTGCYVYSDTVEVSVDTFKNLVSIGSDTNLCAGNLIGLISPSSNLENYTFSWSNGDTTNNISIDTSGSYSIAVTNQFGCIGKDTIYANIIGNAPIVSFNSDSLCLGETYSPTNSSSTTDTSTIVSFVWDFGNNDTDTSTNPSYIFSSPGIHTVTLTATTSAGCVNSTTRDVLIYDLPFANFSNDTGCVSNQYFFIDSSIAPLGASINQWYWDFGDGSSSVFSNPSHTYAVDSIYDVELFVTTDQGCSDTLSKPVNIVSTAAKPSKPDLLYPKNNDQLSDYSIDFTWNVVNNAVRYSLLVDTSNAFTSAQTYTNITGNSIKISLPGNQTYFWKVIAYNYCNDSTNSEFSEFSVFSPSDLNGLTLWLRADSGVVMTSDTVSQWSDLSGNDFHATQLNTPNKPVFIPSVSEINNYPAISFDGANDFLNGPQIPGLDTSSISIFIVTKGRSQTGVAAGLFNIGDNSNGMWLYRRMFSQRFTFTNNNSGNNQILDVNNSMPNTGFIYGLYGMIKSYETNTRLFINSSQRAISNNTSLSGTFLNDNYLIGYAQGFQYFNGSIAEIILFDKSLDSTEQRQVESYIYNKYAPPVNLGPDITIPYGFCDTTISAQKDWLTSYLWKTGDTTASIDIPFPGGKFWIEVTNIFGVVSSDTININYDITTFSGDTSICLGDTLTYNTQINKSIYNNFEWNDGDTNTVKYITEAGFYYYSVQDTNTPSCSFTSDTLFVHIDSFALRDLLEDSASLCAGNSIGAIDTIGIVGYNWSPGGNDPTTTVTTAGYYYLTATNSLGCIASDSILINIKGDAPVVNFAVDNNCEGSAVEFTDQSTTNTGSIVFWQWNFGDQSSAQDENPTHVYDTTGTYTVQLTVETDSGCTGTGSQSIAVKPRPIANFINNTTCAGQPVTFQELSAPPFGSFILDRTWYLANGDTAHVMNPVVQYDSAGSYPVYHIVIAGNGCSDTLMKEVDVFPAINPAIEAENLCLGTDVQFFDASPNFSNTSWFWEFGDGKTSTQQNPKNNYILSGQYNVELTVSNAIGCTESTSKLITIAPQPQVSFLATSSCPGVPAQFSDQTELILGDSIIARVWTFGDSSFISRLPNPIHTYSDTGTYNVTLEIKTEKGCESAATQSVNVLEGPEAAFNFSPTFGGAPLEVSFNNQSIGATDYYWNFGDGSAIDSTPEPVHIYTGEGDYGIVLVAESAAGCTDTAFSSIFITDALYDLIIMDLLTERDVNEDCSYSLSTAVRFANQGTLPITSVKFTLRLNEKISISEIWEGNLQPGDIAVYEFTSATEILDCDQQFYLCVNATYPDGNADQTPADNKSCTSVKPEIVVGSLFPNPAKDILSLDLIAPAAANIKIELIAYNGAQLGTLVDEEIPKGYSHFDFDVSMLGTGGYILAITYREEEISRKFVVLK